MCSIHHRLLLLILSACLLQYILPVCEWLRPWVVDIVLYCEYMCTCLTYTAVSRVLCSLPCTLIPNGAAYVHTPELNRIESNRANAPVLMCDHCCANGML